MSARHPVIGSWRVAVQVGGGPGPANLATLSADGTGIVAFPSPPNCASINPPDCGERRYGPGDSVALLAHVYSGRRHHDRSLVAGVRRPAATGHTGGNASQLIFASIADDLAPGSLP